jgi:hypothetical protein
MSIFFPQNSAYTSNSTEQGKRKLLLLVGALSPFLIYIGSATYKVPDDAAAEVVVRPPSGTFGWIWALNVLTLVAVGWYSAVCVKEFNTAAVLTALVAAYSVVGYLWLYHYEKASTTKDKESYQDSVWDLVAATGLALGIALMMSTQVQGSCVPNIANLIVLGTVVLVTWTGFATQIGVEDAQLSASTL